MWESQQWKMATFLFVFFKVPENRTQETEKRRTFSSVSLLCTVISKSSRPIGARKSLGYCKSLDCVAGGLRGIEKSEKGRGKGKRKKRTLFFHFCFFLLHSSPPLLSFLHLLRKLPRRLLWNLYIYFGMTVIWLQYCKDQDRCTFVDLFYQDDQFMNSGNAFVQDSYSEKVSYKVAWMLSCLGGDLVECCIIISILSKGVRTLHSFPSWRHRLFLFPWLQVTTKLPSTSLLGRFPVRKWDKPLWANGRQQSCLFWASRSAKNTCSNSYL